jgi:hypothetical protein
MAGNPTDSLYRSAPAAVRHRIQPGWTIHRDVIEAVKAAADREGFLTAAWVERELARAAGIEPPPRPPNDPGKKK